MRTCLCLALLAALLGGCSTQDRRALANTAIINWNPPSQVSAQKIMEEYGPPDRIDPSRLIWNNKGPWATISVWNEVPNVEPSSTADILQQSIEYPVVSDRRKALQDFSDKIRINGAGTELTALYPSEELNFLALNLADEIVRGQRDPAEARRFFDKASRLAAAGKQSQYMQGLMFDWAP